LIAPQLANAASLVCGLLSNRRHVLGPDFVENALRDTRSAFALVSQEFSDAVDISGDISAVKVMRLVIYISEIWISILYLSVTILNTSSFGQI
jgi:hypothetical protein